MPKLSIIIPVYNAEKYIRNCLDNILNQGFFDYECILVNDGSKDNSEAICSEYVKKDQRYKLINKVNGGASSARNAGIKAACGDYITFVDSDDYIINEIYSKCFEVIEKESADVVCFDMIRIEDKKEIKILFSDEGLNENFIKYNVYMHSVCNKIFNGNIIRENHVLFDESVKTCEDFLFVFEVMAYAKKVSYINETGYKYNMNINSLTNNVRDRMMIEDQKKVYLLLEEFCKQHGIAEEYKELLQYRRLCWAILYLLIASVFDPEEYRKIIVGQEYYEYGNRKDIRVISYFASRGIDLPAKAYISLKKSLSKNKGA